MLDIVRKIFSVFGHLTCKFKFGE